MWVAEERHAKGASTVRQSTVKDPAPSGAELTSDEVEEAITLGIKGEPSNELVRLMIAARREFFAANGRFLDDDELEREVAERRGGACVDSEE